MILSNKNKLKAAVRWLAVNVSPTFYFTQLYVRYRHRWPNFKHPKDLSEIVMSEIISGKIKDYAQYVDKIKVRDYIESKGLGRYLPKVYGIWENANEIDFDSLPDKFALKTNHGCGEHLFCHGKAAFDAARARKHINNVLNQRYGGRQEVQYSLIRPLCYAEELLEQDGMEQPLDYKFMCCDGEVRFILLASERGTADTGVKFSAYGLDWKKLDYIRGPEKSIHDFTHPTMEKLDEMISIAKTIAKDFGHVRVDLYCVNGKIYIGELTFTPEGGIMSYFTNEAVEAAGHKSRYSE